MEREYLLNLLYDKYIKPTENKKELCIGIEIEMPILNLSKKAVDFDIIHDLSQRFKEEFSFDVDSVDDNNNISSLIHKVTGDVLSYDCSYSNLELSFGKELDLHTIKKRFEKYYGFINEFLNYNNHTLTGMGINPYRKYNIHEPIANGRYRMLHRHLSSYKKYINNIPMFFHSYPDYGMFLSASQAHFDINKEDIIDTINAFTLLEPIKSILFSNSPLNNNEELLCSRDMFWENSTHGINPHNIGMFQKIPESIDEFIEYFASTSIYCTEKDGKYINFEPTNISEYFSKKWIDGEYFDKGEYHDISFSPSVEDLNYLRTFKFEEITFRGTIEFRSVCSQPIYEVFTSSAFHLGLFNSVDKLNEILTNDKVIYNHGYNATELRKLFNKRKLPEFLDKNAFRDLIIKILNLSLKGLNKRKLGEELYLKPLYKRAELLTNPASDWLDRLDNGEDIEEIIKDYSRL
ncbi:MAG: hypothetical protein LBT10_02930 [Methanobrevibacter sp.]|jgi:gamma-glutamylcysteine synthetase|nr:hypothetical protein [Methanobrevibacter sp.]